MESNSVTCRPQLMKLLLGSLADLALAQVKCKICFSLFLSVLFFLSQGTPPKP